MKQNIVLPSLEKYGRGPLLNGRRENAVADREFKRFRIKTVSRNQAVGRLSGGNQQKVVISAMGLNDPELVIFDEPTRGVDIGAKQEIYHYISRSEEHTSEPQSLMRISYAVFCLKKKKKK